MHYIIIMAILNSKDETQNERFLFTLYDLVEILVEVFEQVHIHDIQDYKYIICLNKKVLKANYAFVIQFFQAFDLIKNILELQRIHFISIEYFYSYILACLNIFTHFHD